MAAPQYTYDPITQSYKLVQQPMDQQPSQSRGLYDLSAGGAEESPNGYGIGFGGTPVGMSLSPVATEIGVAAQNFGQAHKGTTFGMPNMVVSPVMSLVSFGSEKVGNAIMGTQVDPVANPAMPAETQIGSYGTPTAGLAGLSEAISDADETQDSNAGMAEAANAVAAAAAVAAANQTAQTEAANAAAATTGTASGTGGSAAGGTDASGGGGGPTGDAAVSGAANEASHAADGNNPGDSSSSGGCFLTTAATRYMGQPDNGPVLNALRNFRDTYMRKDKEKSKDVDWYYTNAPRIMRELDKRPDAPEVYREMYKEYIYPAYKAIKEGNKVEAYTTYKALVNFAKRKSGIENDELTPKPKHMAGGGIASIAREGMNYQGGGYATPRPYIYNQPTMMAEGGLAAAQQTQNAGRGPDTMLVHMAPQEVAGLQALAMAHGGSLTINPKTGLPEAGFLRAILPTLAGMALAPVTGGLSAAMLVGGGTALATGSLKKGLMAGLGAFGGANIASGLSAAAGPEIVPEVVSTATPATSAATTITPEMLNAMPPVDLTEPLGGAVGNMVPTPANTITPNMLDPSAMGRYNLQPTAAFQQNFAQLGGPGAETVSMGGQQFQAFPTETGETVLSPLKGGQQLYVQPPGTFTPPPEVVQAPPPVSDVYPEEFTRGTAAGIKPPPSTPTTYARMGRGFENLFDQGDVGTQARKAFGEKAGYGSLASAAAPVLTQEPEPIQKRKAYIRPYDVNVVNRSAENAPLYGPGSTSGREMLSYEYTARPIYEAADGGLMALKAGGVAKKSKKLGGDPYYKFADSRKDTSMEAALDANFAKGGAPRYLNGKGDGMSDDIPAIIDGKQPARLADGEFVIPADVVSHLGNGSSKAGAKKLYSMMDRIRKARTGKKSQAPAVKSERYMPA